MTATGRQTALTAEQRQTAAFLADVLQAVVQMTVQQACSQVCSALHSCKQIKLQRAILHMAEDLPCAQVASGLRAQVSAVGDLPSLAQAAAASAVAVGMQLLHAVAASPQWASKIPCGSFCASLESALPGDGGPRVSLQVKAAFVLSRPLLIEQPPALGAGQQHGALR